MGAAAVAVLMVGALGLSHPHAVPGVPAPQSGLALLAVTIGIACLVVVSVRAATTVLLTRRPRDLCVLIGLAILICALVAQYMFDWGEAGFWMGHGMEVLGIGLVGFPVALDAWTAVPSRPLAGDLRVVDLVAREEAFLGRGVHALLRRLEEKDPATDGHTRRVALLAVQVGEELGLPPTRLRRLALGGILHDIGKLRVPDGILKKPGPLTDDEFRVIRRHPDWGAALLAELGFAPEVRAIVRDHHERLDGSGYPQGLPAHQLSLEARIVAVCDVYDALVSPRVYRDAWPAGRALDLLRDETGTGFSPECVAALERVLERDAAAGLGASPSSPRSLPTSTRTLRQPSRTACTKRVAKAPSPTAPATRFVAPARTSPAANTPGRTVSRRWGARSARGQISLPSHAAAAGPHSR